MLLGDFNVNLNGEEENPGSNNNVLKDKLLDSLPIEGFTQNIKKNTRHCINAKSPLIDHIWIKNMSKLIQVRTMDFISDHDLILSVHKLNGNVFTKTSIKSRDFRKFVKEEFILELCGLNWSEIYDIEDPTIIATSITEKFCYPLN